MLFLSLLWNACITLTTYILDLYVLTVWESSLTDIPAVNGYKHIDDALKTQQPNTQNHQTLQPHTSPGPHEWHQQTHFPPEALPCWTRDHLHIALSFRLLLRSRRKRKHITQRSFRQWNIGTEKKKKKGFQWLLFLPLQSGQMMLARFHFPVHFVSCVF